MIGDQLPRVATIASVTLLVGLVLLGCQTQAPPATPTKAAAAQAPAATQPPAAAPTQAPAPAQATAAPATAAPTQAPVALKLGISLPMTGPTARTAMNSDRFMRMAIDDANAKGGITAGGKTYRVEAITADDKFNAEGGRSAADRLVLAEKVKIVLGPGGYSATAGAQPVTEGNKVLMFATAALDENLGPKFPLTLAGGSPHNRMRVPAMLDWLVKNHPQAKRLAVTIYDDASGRAYSALVEEEAKARGLTFVGKELFPMDIKDFNPLIVRLLQQKPDAIDIGGAGASAAFFTGIAKALSEQGYRGVFYGAWGGSYLLQAGAAAEGYTYPVIADPNAAVVPARAKDAIQRIGQKYGAADLEVSGALINTLPDVMLQAIAKAGTVDDTEKIAKVLREGEWDTIFGKARFVGTKTFGVPAYLETPVFFSKVEGGKIITFDFKMGTMP